MAGMDFSAVVTLTGPLQSIVFNTYAANVNGEKWFAELEGWEAAPRRPVTLENTTDDGEGPVFGRLSPRPITLSGVIETTTLALLKQARDRFMAACMMLPEQLGSLLVADPVSTQAKVYSAGAPKWRIITCQGGRAIAEFQAMFVAPDPRKYASSVSSLTLGNGLATPTPSLSASNTGGSLGAATYGYRVSALNGVGETVASAEVQASLAPLVTPGRPSLTLGSTGTLSNVGIYAYRVSAVNASGETLASPEALIPVGGSGSTTSITVAWAPVPGATSYNVYGRSSGAELKLTATPVVGTSFVDTGAVTPSGALPSSNTTGTTTGSITLAWPAVTGAFWYNVYGRTPGGEQKMTPAAISATSFVDNGSVTPSGGLPPGGFATTVTNNGTYYTAPTLTVSGPATNPAALSIAGYRLTINTAVPSGSTLVVDTGAKTVLLNGVLRMDLIDNASTWPLLTPGANAVVYVGGGTATLAYRDAYA